MGCAIVDDVTQDATRAVRNLPDAHASWQAFWRNARFRRAIVRIDTAVYSIRDVDRFREEQLEVLHEALGQVVRAIEIHSSSLGGAVRDRVDREYFRGAKERLRLAAEALEQGLTPNPAHRPTEDEMLARFTARVRQIA